MPARSFFTITLQPVANQYQWNIELVPLKPAANFNGFPRKDGR